ncbi:uncharacterized protein LOC118746463 [Rhagoletis pomonella]|uniref:uncharacterized protein LOC118746463 n=1 Tax=Rhagoletis pomonella TaxID=28610 RepID=UPI00177AC517|nr:uncharacterized protein LOC118746463 [Rhagoletis pomonella]
MVRQLKQQQIILRFLLILSTLVAATHSFEVESLEHVEKFKPSIFIEKLAPEQANQIFRSPVEVATNHTGLHIMWRKFVVRVTSEMHSSALSKSFGITNMPSGEDMSPIITERIRLMNIAAEVEFENRIINGVLTFMKILLALDILILVGVLGMLISGFDKTKASAKDEVVKV